VVAYYRIDNFAALTPRAEELRRSEREMIEGSDLVLANSPALAELPTEMGARVHLFPPSVNLDAFSPVAPLEDNSNGNGGSPAERSSIERVRRLAHPMIGYVGAVSSHINDALMAGLARQRPEWSWVFVGPRNNSFPTGFDELPNVHFLGQQPHPSLVNFIREFDVCIIPYRLNQYTATVFPTKLNEYLAVGKPVVSTNLPAVCEFNERHGVLTISDEMPENFLRAVETALGESGELAAERRRTAATHGDWQKRLEEVSVLFEAAFRAKGD